MRKKLEKIYMALIFILLYAPIVTLVVLSFNASKTRAKWGGFTLHWYRSLFANTEIMNALYTTLIIALLASAIATILGTLACIGINSMSKKSRTLFMGITNIPMLNGEIVMGISLMLLFIICRIQLGFGTILMAHITFNVPYVILSVMPKLKQTNKSTYEAALDLGASPLYAFWKVIFPDIMPGVVSGFLLSFTMSLDDFVITYFTKGPGVDTLSTKIYAEVRKGIKPEMYSLSTILFVTVLLLLLLVNVLLNEPARPRFSLLDSVPRLRFFQAVLCLQQFLLCICHKNPSSLSFLPDDLIAQSVGKLDGLRVSQGLPLELV